MCLEQKQSQSKSDVYLGHCPLDALRGCTLARPAGRGAGGGGGAHLGIYVLQAEKLGSSRGSCPWISGEDVMCGL